MAYKIKIGSYVYRPYSNTFWQVTDMYYRIKPTIYKSGGASTCNELCVTVVKVLEKRLTNPQKKITKVDMPMGCFTLLTPEWYKKHLYFQKQGVLWDLICLNSSQNIL